MLMEPLRTNQRTKGGKKMLENAKTEEMDLTQMILEIDVINHNRI